MSAYRFFGLVDDDDSSTEYLDSLARDPDKRPTVLRQLMAAQYYEIIETDTTKMTLKMLESAFETDFAVSGATKQKAITFFLKAARFSDIPLSPYLLTQLRNTGPRKKRSANLKAAPLQSGETSGRDIKPVLPGNSGAESHSIRLLSGGTVTVSMTFNPFKLPPEDRAFVFSLVDQIQEYEKAHPLTVGSEVEEED